LYIRFFQEICIEELSNLSDSILSDNEKTKEIFNVLKGYKRFEQEEEDFVPILKGLLKAALKEPKNAQNDLNQLEGNKNLESKLGKEKMEKWISGHEKQYEICGEQITFYDSKEIIESLNMGVVTDSCLNIKEGANGFSAVTNTVDNNKKAVYLKVDGKKVGRTLAVLTDKGIMTFHIYNNRSELDISEAWLDYFTEYAKKVNVPLIIPNTYLDNKFRGLLEKRNAKKKEIKAKLHRAVAPRWYSDQICAQRDESGYKLRCTAYVINP
ncbi:hypothetical protein HY643_00365, partial [Candidatus Woesearchaeota archaeon]|nr:hypothetical protein [Candidatus Woesearchaeota archaeon]